MTLYILLQDAGVTGGASKVLYVQAATNVPATEAWTMRAKTPAGRDRQVGRRRRVSARTIDESTADAESSAMLPLRKLLTAWMLGKAMPSVSR